MLFFSFPNQETLFEKLTWNLPHILKLFYYYYYGFTCRKHARALVSLFLSSIESRDEVYALQRGAGNYFWVLVLMHRTVQLTQLLYYQHRLDGIEAYCIIREYCQMWKTNTNSPIVRSSNENIYHKETNCTAVRWAPNSEMSMPNKDGRAALILNIHHLNYWIFTKNKMEHPFHF